MKERDMIKRMKEIRALDITEYKKGLMLTEFLPARPAYNKDNRHQLDKFLSTCLEVRQLYDSIKDE